MRGWVRWCLRVFVAVQLLVAAEKVRDTYAVYADVCEPVPWVFFGLVPASWFGLEWSAPRNKTWCTPVANVLSPGMVMALAHQFVAACWDALAQHPTVVFLLGSSLVSVTAWPWWSRRTFERRHAARAPRVGAVSFGNSKSVD